MSRQSEENLSSEVGFLMKKFQIDKLLDCQKLQSELNGQRVDDEHLFIVMHQVSINIVQHF